MPTPYRLVHGLLLACVVLAPRCAADATELIIVGGKIATMEADQPLAEAVAIDNGRIFAVGNREDIEKLAGERTQRLELDGQLVVPGLIESHGHFVSLGQSRMMLDFSQVQTWDEIVEMARQAALEKEPGEWILGRGWHQEKWNELPAETVEGYPVHRSLSQATQNHPVLFTHASGHMSIVNAQAMQLAGIEAASDPQGGEILRDQDGHATGVLREAAQQLVTHLTEKFGDTTSQVKRAIQLASKECLENGITTFQDAGSSFQIATLVRQAAESGDLPIRIWMMTNESNDRLKRELEKHIVRRAADDHFTLAGIKRSVDGALGAHGAWLLEPYDDLVSSSGLNTYPIHDLQEATKIAIDHGCQLCVHAIGDRANHETLNVFATALAANPAKRSRRWRIEHAQHLDRADIPRFAQLGIIPSMQGIHCTSDAVFVMQRLGARRAKAGAYVWRDLLDSGARIANGTDVPVESLNPLASFYASVTRKLSSGVAFFPEQSMTREEALRSYTLDAAYAAFEEDIKGSLTRGKLADITILSKDILTIAEDELPGVQVDYTIVGGRVLYQRSKEATRTSP